jgi:hypothetical protein
MLNILAIKEMQIKTTLGFHLTQEEQPPSRKQAGANAGEEWGLAPHTLLVGT